MDGMINAYINKMKEIQSHILELLENEENFETNMSNLKNTIEDHKIRENRNELKILLRLVLKISNNHHRGPNFFNNIDQILRYLANDIKEKLNNSEIFDIFKSNKRILLFLLKEEIFHFDKYSGSIISTQKYQNWKYPQYFAPEVKPFIENCNCGIDDELPENFEEKRAKGENDEYICQLIQNDLLEQFIDYINKNNYELDSTICTSIYETNLYLLKKEENPKLVEYAAFHNAVKILNYIKTEYSTKQLKFPKNIWEYAVHSNNPELVHMFEEDEHQTNLSHFEPLKCHHNDIFKYFMEEYSDELNKSVRLYMDKYICVYVIQALKSFNFEFLSPVFLDLRRMLFNLCELEMFPLIEILINNDKYLTQIKILISF